MRVLNNDELTEVQEEEALANAPESQEPPDVSSELAGYVRKCWEQAYQAKNTLQERLLTNLRNFNSQYDPLKLAEIKKLRGSEVFIPLTSTKINAANAWITDIYFNSQGERPWDIESTPVPELPPSVEEQVRQDVLLEVGQVVMQYAAMTAQDPTLLMQRYQDQIIERTFYRMRKKSQAAIEDLKREIGDQLEEGNWYEELKKVIMDICIYEFACLKGPIYRREKYFRREMNPMTGTYSNKITEDIKPVFERRSPFCIYPAPDSQEVNRDYIFDLLTYNLKDLYDMIGLDGFNEEAIREVIQQYKGGRLKEWAHFKSDVTDQQSRGNASIYETKDKVDVLEFWGAINGQMLLDWGMDSLEVDDPDKYYDVCVWLVGTKVIKAMMNPDPMGKKPFHITSYVKNNDAVAGGKGLATLLEAFQQICNSLARAMVNNSAIASGPLVEYNEERMPTGYDPVLYPWKTFASTNGAMSDAPAVRFYQAQVITEQLLRVFDYFSKLADQYSIPAYAHGDTKVGGGGNTASGLSMLMDSADRVIKGVVKNIDEVVASSIELLYTFNMFHDPDAIDYVGDVRIVARGTSAMLQKETQTVRRTDFLALTNNPVDVQIIGLEARKELLKETAISLNLEHVAKKFPIVDEIDELKVEVERLLQAQQAQEVAMARAETLANQPGSGKAPAEKQPALDLAGNTQSGQDQRVLTQESTPQMRPEVA